jgi:hypothetical protein
VWVNQFENADRIFILEELLHLLNQGIYLSKENAKLKLYQNLQELAKHFKYNTLSDFLRNCHFLDLQEDDKSQKHILKLMDDLLIEKYNFSIQDCGTVAHKHFIYLDDVVATGNTVFDDLSVWLTTVNQMGIPYHQLFTDGKINLIVNVFCCHTWGWDNTQFRLEKKFRNTKFLKGILMRHSFTIENNIFMNRQKLNCLYPIIDSANIERYEKYLTNLMSWTRAERAYRKSNKPEVEMFFSNAENRINFEHIMLDHGIKILNRVKDLQSKRIRPLGYTMQSHKTFGLGTLFFTWRNISNTCPLVFWWSNPAHGWKGLFPLKNRGNNKKLAGT